MFNNIKYKLDMQHSKRNQYIWNLKSYFFKNEQIYGAGFARSDGWTGRYEAICDGGEEFQI